ncbi:MAG: YdcF family protein [Planctomycetaceae bacterium]
MAASPAWMAVARGSAFFLSAVILLTLLGDLRSLADSADFSWLDFSPLPVTWARGFIGLLGALLFIFAVFPSIPGIFRALAVLCVVAALGVSSWNAYKYYDAFREGEIHSRVPIAFSLHVAALLIVVLAGLFAGRRRIVKPGRDLLYAIVTIGICTAGFPIAQMFCEGQTDERRAADAAVVFACNLPNGDEAAKNLRARVKAACDLHAAQQVRTLILAGGPGEGGVHQAEMMRQIAIEFGVPETDLVADTTGTDTRTAVTGSIELLKQRNLYSVLIVDDFYLLPRIKLGYRRAGVPVETVPVPETTEPPRWKALRKEIVNEAKALWLFSLEPLML